MPLTNNINITFPENFGFNPSFLPDLEKLNPNVNIKLLSGNQLNISEKDFSFDEYDFLELKIPSYFTINEIQFEEICTQNSETKIELNPDSKIIINMLTPEIIAAFTLAIGAAIYLWNKSSKQGKTYSESARYDLTDGKTTKYRAPDVSFISFEKTTREFLAKNKFLKIAPTLCVEIVSSKNGLKQNLKKIADDWMPAGTDIALVVCSYNEKYYLFEKDNTEYKEFDFSVPFTHESLKALSIDFAELLEEAKEG